MWNIQLELSISLPHRQSKRVIISFEINVDNLLVTFISHTIAITDNAKWNFSHAEINVGNSAKKIFHSKLWHSKLICVIGWCYLDRLKLLDRNEQRNWEHLGRPKGEDRRFLLVIPQSIEFQNLARVGVGWDGICQSVLWILGED